jgi:C-8 sterol isomerase
MPSKSSKSKASSGGCCSLTRVLTWVGILIGILTPIIYILEQNLESFYIFEREQLHDLSQRAIKAHGNDTGAIVKYIVDELQAKHPSNVNPYHDVPEEWFFNNAGGAMGGMYVIHASKYCYLLSPPTIRLSPFAVLRR